MSFQRHVLNKFPSWSTSKKKIGKLIVSNDILIENAIGSLQVDFCNKFIGGGIICGGSVQEEIRFSINTELISSLLFTAPLKDNESLLMKGSIQFSKYTGYGSTLKYDGDFLQKNDTQTESEIIAMDATSFPYLESKCQFEEKFILRELNKAYVAFDTKSNSTQIATGNWGCGVFNGDKYLKSIIQLMAASMVGKDILYCTFKDTIFAEHLTKFYNYLVIKEITIGNLWKIINSYNPDFNETFFGYIEKQISHHKCDIL